MSSATSVVVKVILEDNGNVQPNPVYITVNQDQSIFKCLVKKFGDSQYWTKLNYNVNGVIVTGWRLIPPSGIPNSDPTLRFKYVFDEHFQKVFTKQDRPTYGIYLRRRT
jgi:hypothetical protein